MPTFTMYKLLAGFPQKHADIFQNLANEKKIVIISRELNPLCTDLMLDRYASKGFHIKAKTCDWGPMAGFVPDDPRYTKASQDIEKQREAIIQARAHGVKSVPLLISTQRVYDLVNNDIIKMPITVNDTALVTAYNGGSKKIFYLIKQPHKVNMWCICYDKGESPDNTEENERVAKESNLSLNGYIPVCGLINPGDSYLDHKSAVCGDYDLWGVISPCGASSSYNDRPLPLRSTLKQGVAQGLINRCEKAGLIYKPNEIAKLAAEKEDKHLGNISLKIMKLGSEINSRIGHKVVVHSDYFGNPFGDIDFPLIFFTPQMPIVVVDNTAELKRYLQQLSLKDYDIKLNPAWWV